MFVSHTFVCDLRRTDGDKIQASIMARNLAEAIWEHLIFVLSARADGEARQDRSVSISLFVIDMDGSLHMLLPTDEFSLAAVRKALNAFMACEMDGRVETGEKDPLAAAIDYASYGSIHSVFAFVADALPWTDVIEKTIRRVEAAGSEIELSFAILSSEETPCTLRDTIARIESVSVCQIVNSDDTIFQFFRNNTSKMFVNSSKEMLVVNDQRIECISVPLLLGDPQLEKISICKCHNLSVKTKITFECTVSGKNVRETREKLGIGTLVCDTEPLQTDHRIQCHCTIDLANISQSFLFGGSRYLQSSSPVFHRMITEMRCHKQAIIAQRIPSLEIGGEFLLLVADSLIPVIHYKKIANRAQLLRLDISSDVPMPSDVYTTPVLPEMKHIESISPFDLGRDEIISWLH